MTDDALCTAVGEAVRTVAAAKIVPRWRQLAAVDVSEKTGPRDLVTVAGRLAEGRLAEEIDRAAARIGGLRGGDSPAGRRAMGE